MESVRRNRAPNVTTLVRICGNCFAVRWDAQRLVIRQVRGQEPAADHLGGPLAPAYLGHGVVHRGRCPLAGCALARQGFSHRLGAEDVRAEGVTGDAGGGLHLEHAVSGHLAAEAPVGDDVLADGELLGE